MKCPRRAEVTSKYWKATDEVPKRRKGGLKLPKGIVPIRQSQDVGSMWGLREVLLPTAEIGL